MKKKTKIFWTDKDFIADQEKEGPFHYKTINSFYASPPWRRLRLYKLSIDPFCERCDQRGLNVPADEVHHFKEVSEYPELALEITNLESLCKKCHSQESYKYLQKSDHNRPRGHIKTYGSERGIPGKEFK